MLANTESCTHPNEYYMFKNGKYVRMCDDCGMGK